MTATPCAGYQLDLTSRLHITDAAAMLSSLIRRTPLVEAKLPTGQRICLKLESMQHTGSFKPRGVFQHVLASPVRPQELMVASDGNHAIAVAYVAQQLGIRATILVTTETASSTVHRLAGYGAHVVAVQGSFAEAQQVCHVMAAQRQAMIVPACDSAEILKGQGTIGLEIEGQAPDCDTIVAPIGGGGLMGGLASWFGRSSTLVGVEPASYPAYAVATAHHAASPVVPEGSAIGQLPWIAMRTAGVRSATVSGPEILGARQWLWQEMRIAAEPGGVAGLAAMMTGRIPHDAHYSKACVVITGGNTDSSDLIPRS